MALSMPADSEIKPKPMTHAMMRVMLAVRDSGLNFSDDLNTLKMSITRGIPIDMMTPREHINPHVNS